jgi:hypothetical protein
LTWAFGLLDPPQRKTEGVQPKHRFTQRLKFEVSVKPNFLAMTWNGCVEEVRSERPVSRRHSSTIDL